MRDVLCLVFPDCRKTTFSAGHMTVLSMQSGHYASFYIHCPPKGRPGMSNVSPLFVISGLSFDSTLLSPHSVFCLALLLFLSYLFFFCLLVHSSELFPENSSKVCVKRQASLCGFCLAAKSGKLVGGMCSMLPYGTGICCYAFI